MSNINYTLGKDYLVFTGINPSISYYLQNWDGLGLTGGDVTSGSPYGPIYSPGDVIVYNTLSCTFIIDEEWRVYETLSNMMIANAPLDGENYNPTLTDINLYLYNNTAQKTVAHITLYNGYLQSIMNVTNAYNTSDNVSPPKLMNCIIKYQYSKFFRESEE